MPYTGGSKVVADLLGGQSQSGVLKPSESKAQIEEGLVKPIAVFANERLEMFPDVPTFKDKGYDVFPYGPRGPDGLCGRARQPPADVRDQADPGVPSGDPGSAFKATFQDERVPRRRPHRRRR